MTKSVWVLCCGLLIALCIGTGCYSRSEASTLSRRSPKHTNSRASQLDSLRHHLDVLNHAARAVDSLARLLGKNPIELHIDTNLLNRLREQLPYFFQVPQAQQRSRIAPYQDEPEYLIPVPGSIPGQSDPQFNGGQGLDPMPRLFVPRAPSQLHQELPNYTTHRSFYPVAGH